MKKEFDAVEMMHEGARALQILLKDMTPEEREQFWKSETEALREEQRQVKSKQTSSTG